MGHLSLIGISHSNTISHAPIRPPSGHRGVGLVVETAVLAANTMPLPYRDDMVPPALDDYLRGRHVLRICPRGILIE